MDSAHIRINYGISRKFLYLFIFYLLIPSPIQLFVYNYIFNVNVRYNLVVIISSMLIAKIFSFKCYILFYMTIVIIFGMLLLLG